MSNLPTKVLAQRLSGCELRVAEGLEVGRRAFAAIGHALREIRDDKLYLGSHGSFETYCRERWGFSRQHAYRMIDGADVVALLSPRTDADPPAPQHEKHARPLASLPPAARADAWREAVETAPDGKVTAAHVQATVDARWPGTSPGVSPRGDNDSGQGNDLRDAAAPEPTEEAPDPIAEWERAEKELEAARETIVALQTDDATREVAAWTEKYHRLEGRLRQESRTLATAQEQAARQTKLLREIRELLKVERDRDILPAIRDLLR